MSKSIAPLADAPTLPALVDRAVNVLATARNAAEILDGLAMASVVYDAAKRAARMAKAKGAHDELIAKVHRAQADLLDAEAAAKRKLADEYDAAQERGEVATRQNNPGSVGHVPDQNMPPATAADLGISRKDIHEARLIRDAEVAEPGIVRRTVDAAVAAGEEPTRAKLRRTVLEKRQPKPKRKPRRRQAVESTETQHDRDLSMLLGVWEAACESARTAFLATVHSGGQ